MHVGIKWVGVEKGKRGREGEGRGRRSGSPDPGEVVPQILELWLQLVGLARPQVAIVTTMVAHLRD